MNFWRTPKGINISDIPTWRTLSQRHPEHTDGSQKNEEVFAEKVSLFEGDITKLNVDAIVNAANERLLGGGGVDGAIHKAAGSKLLQECRALQGCKTGEAKTTSGYQLPSKYVIHTVGPKGENKDLLKKAYQSSLHQMEEKHLRTIAFPCISTGVYGYPPEKAAEVALTTVKTFIQQNPNKVDRVVFCVYQKQDYQIYQNLMQKYFPA